MRNPRAIFELFNHSSAKNRAEVNKRKTMGGHVLKKILISNFLVVILVMLLCGSSQATTVTIATFADPAVNESMPLFTIDLVNDLITGGWADTKTGLSLTIPYSGNTYTNAFFTMTDVNYYGDIMGGETEGGTIKFFADGQDTSSAALIQIDFEKAYLTPFGFGTTAPFFFIDVVTITGSEIIGSLTDESFIFGFANHVPLSGDWNKGCTATASFTSSASVVPEPATIMLLGTASIWVFVRKKQQFLGSHRRK